MKWCIFYGAVHDSFIIFSFDFWFGGVYIASRKAQVPCLPGSVVDPDDLTYLNFDTYQHSYITIFERRMNNMKTLITMMNAMKYYKFEELVQEEETIQEKISSDMAMPAFQKMLGSIRQKFFLNRG